MSLYVGDVGAELSITTESTALLETDTLTLMVTKPSGATAEWEVASPPDFLVPSTGAITYYTKVSTELSEQGVYKIQIRRVTDEGDETKSDIGNFVVKEPLF